MLTYIEIIDKYTLNKIALVEPKECWFELSFNRVGECELYAVANTNNKASLLKGNFLKIPNKDYIWVIEKISYTYVDGVPMIDAKGYEAKWLLNKRIIQEPVELPAQVALAIEQLVYNNLGAGADAARQIIGFNVYTSGITTTLSDTQASRGNLLDFVNNLLNTYNLGGIVLYQQNKLLFKVYEGRDLSASIRFSQSLDNLLESTYSIDDTNLGTTVLAVSTVETTDYTETYDSGATGIDRAEKLYKSNLSLEYTPQGATEPVKLDLSNPADLALYKSWLQQEAYTDLNNYTSKNEINSILDLINSNYEFEDDYFLGDLVGVIDDYFNYNAAAQILKITIKQDSGGYGEEVEYKI